MTTSQIVKKLNDLAKIGIVNAKEDTEVLLEAAKRMTELRAKACPKWNWWLIMDDGMFLESVSEDGETEWTKNEEDAMQFMPEDMEIAKTIANAFCGQVVLYGDYDGFGAVITFE